MGRLLRFVRAAAYWCEDQFEWLFHNSLFPAQILLLLLASWGLLGADAAGAAVAAAAGSSFLRNSQVNALPNAPSPGGRVRSVWLRTSSGEGVPPAQPARPTARMNAMNGLVITEALRGSVEIKKGSEHCISDPWVTAP